MKSAKTKFVRVILAGGLGNQLFQYFAGLSIAERLGSDLILDPRLIFSGVAGHSESITDLNLPHAVSLKKATGPSGQILFWIDRLYLGLAGKLLKNRKLLYKLLGHYRSGVVGYDPRLRFLKSPVVLMGYFQSWRYVDSVGASGIIDKIRYNGGSEWFIDTRELISRSTRPLALHVRRGDYGVHRRHGMLSMEYYKAALENLRLEGIEWEDVWVFSDQIESAQSELSTLFAESANVHYVTPPEDSHSLESLFLMSEFPTLITANSTFSWWAAKLGPTDKRIVCPEKWFAEMTDPTDLYPDDWIKVPSYWDAADSGLLKKTAIDSKPREPLGGLG